MGKNYQSLCAQKLPSFCWQTQKTMVVYSHIWQKCLHIYKNIEEKSSDWVFSQRVSDGEKEAERKIMKMASELHSWAKDL